MSSTTRTTKKPMLFVSNATDIKKLANSICRQNSKNYEDDDSPTVLRAVGAGALNQAIKSIVIANQEFIREGRVARFTPNFSTISFAPSQGDRVQDRQNERTAIELSLKMYRV